MTGAPPDSTGDHGITIAPGRANDPPVRALIDALDTLQLSLYPAESNHLVDIAELLREEVVFLVARRDGAVLGCGAVMLKGDDGRYGEIKRMYVAQDARGCGLGARLVAALEAATQARDVGVLRLETGVHQPDAIRLYEKCGYIVRGPFADYAPDPLSVFMEKNLT